MFYVTLDKVTKEPTGVVNILPKALPEWEAKFDLIEVDESYRGKHGYELKYENNQIRFATQQEIDDYLDSIKPKTEKEKFLDMLKDPDVKAEIKKIK